MTTANPHPDPAAPAPAEERALHGLVIGTVISDKRHQTRTVVVSFHVRHPKYGKYLARRTRCQVHDPENQSHLGDRVEIVNCRPVSKTKTWRLVRVVQKSAGQFEHVTEVKTQKAADPAP